MKTRLLILAACLGVTAVSAKKVKFAVNMSGQTINSTGIHVFGDFQTAAGFPQGDWAPETTLLTRETADTNIYSVVVDIPAFKKYEYKFLNGDQSYEVEFVPEESRVNYNFSDNRWIYIDSAANDTTYIGALLFSGNAPAGKKMVHFMVNMQDETVSTAGVHVAGSFNNWSTTATPMYSFYNKMYEILLFADSATYEFKYYNGNTVANAESLTGSCATNGNRTVALTVDKTLDSLCFGKCVACVSTTGMQEEQLQAVSVYPNPANDWLHLSVAGATYSRYTVTVTDLSGRTIAKTESALQGDEISIGVSTLNPGAYFLLLENGSELIRVRFMKQ